MTSGLGYLGGIVVGAFVVVHALATRPGTWILFVRLIAVAHVAMVVELALFPLPTDPVLIGDFRASAAGTDQIARTVNLVPWVTIGPSLHRLFDLRLDTQEVRNLVGNFVLLMPLGWYGPILWPRLRNIVWFILAAIGFSTAIEVAQLAITLGLGYAHATDIDDVIVNASGATVAFVALWVGRQLGLRPRHATA